MPATVIARSASDVAISMPGRTAAGAGGERALVAVNEIAALRSQWQERVARTGWMGVACIFSWLRQMEARRQT